MGSSALEAKRRRSFVRSSQLLYSGHHTFPGSPSWIHSRHHPDGDTNFGGWELNSSAGRRSLYLSNRCHLNIFKSNGDDRFNRRSTHDFICEILCCVTVADGLIKAASSNGPRRKSTGELHRLGSTCLARFVQKPIKSTVSRLRATG